jgi:hypothetical protein
MKIIIIITKLFIYLRADLTVQRPTRKQARIKKKIKEETDKTKTHKQIKDQTRTIYII